MCCVSEALSQTVNAPDVAVLGWRTPWDSPVLGVDWNLVEDLVLHHHRRWGMSQNAHIAAATACLVV